MIDDNAGEYTFGNSAVK